MDWKEQIPERYRVTYDNGVFRILDCWHETITNINDLTIDIPDSSPAMTIISTEQVSALMGKLDVMGWLEKYANRTYLSDGATGSPSPDIREVAIKEISVVVTQEKIDPSIAKDAIAAIKQIVGEK